MAPAETIAESEAAQRPARALGLRLALVALLAAAVSIFFLLGGDRYLSWDSLRGQVDSFKEQVHEHLLWSVVLYFVLYVTVTALSLPVATGVTLIGGALFDPWLGTAVISLAATAGATLAFLSSRFLFRAWVERRFGPRLQSLNRGVVRDGAYYLFTLRLVPIFPFFLVNLGMGLTGIRVWTYVWVSYLGMLPATFIYANVGDKLAGINTPADVLSPGMVLALALLGIMPLTLKLLLRWWSRART